jgi:hypothetical protein
MSFTNWVINKKEKMDTLHDLKKLLEHLHSLGKTPRDLREYLTDNIDTISSKMSGNIISWTLETKKRKWEFMVHVNSDPYLFVYIVPSLHNEYYNTPITITYQSIGKSLCYEVSDTNSKFIKTLSHGLESIGAKRVCSTSNNNI